MNLQLEGKRALITGSSSGIGEAIARGLAREGASVVVHGRREAEVRRVAGEIGRHSKAAIAIGDLVDDTQAAHVAEQALSAFGGIDILVNNAGAFPQASWFEGPASLWLDMYNQNVASMVRMIQQIVPPMRERGWGRVINLASIVGDLPRPEGAHYHASKAANLNLTVSLSKALAGTGVTVNTISPGLIRTPATEPWMRTWAQQNDWGEDWAEIERQTAIHLAPNNSGRVGQPDDVAHAVVFLASHQASFINGANLRVDGGSNPTVN